MTITYHAGRRIQGLSTDVVNTPTFEDDFSSDNWTDKDSTNIGVSGGTLTGENVLDGGDDTSYYDLTSTSDTNWILRFKGTYTTTYGTGNASKILYVGLSSDTNAQSTAKDFAGFIFEQWNLPQFRISGGVVNNTTLEYASSLSNLNALNTSSATTVTNYFEIKRDNDNFTFTVYSNSDYTGQLATVTRTVSSVTTLRYLVLTNRDISASNTGSLTVSVDDLTFYNGVSSLTSKPTNVQSGSRFEETDTRKIYYGALPSVTYEDDFSSDNFNDTGTKIGVANNTLEWNGVQNGSVHGSTIDLTSINTKAFFRAKLRINTLTAPSSASNFVLIGFSDSDHATAGDSNQDGIGLIIQNDTGTNSFSAMHVDGAPFAPNSGTTFTTVPATGTDYFIEVVLDNGTWYVRIYSDSNYSVLTEQETGSMTATGLRYFGIKMRSSVNVNGTFDGYIDDFKFYNGFTNTTDFTWTEES